ncbi:hypothetical protein SD37_13830 [Amycolatopsis orientalis]|uniref:Uncharacterized protein n=1 Tax=Amycolatopsis orientalis TaxID=31958 RepID=A0A193BWT9_AMYOR|nr:hypothetical protein SD37_13830 [Amycolatopsis orientalis]
MPDLHDADFAGPLTFKVGKEAFTDRGLGLRQELKDAFTACDERKAPFSTARVAAAREQAERPRPRLTAKASPQP